MHSLYIKRLILFGLVGLLALSAGFIAVGVEQAVWLFRYTAYWFITVSVILWCYVALQMWRGWNRKALLLQAGKEWPWWSVALLATILSIFIHQSPGFKVVNDEPTQQATARSLFETKQAAAAYRAYDLGQGLKVSHSLVDKRPILYAWLVSQVHGFTGYRESNGFWVNRFLGVLITVALYVFGRRMAGPAGGCLLSLLMLLPPMQAHLANGGGFDIMNLLFIVMLGLAMAWHLEGRTVETEGFLLLTGVLLVNLRYESVLFLLPLGLALLVVWRSGSAPKLGWVAFVVPLLTIARMWQQRVFETADTWQLSSKPEANGSPFGLGFFYNNVGHAMNYWFSFKEESANSIILSVLGWGCAGFWVVLFFNRYRSWARGDLSSWASYLLWLGAGLHLGLMMVYFWGQFDDVLTQRLALPSHLWFALGIVGVVSSFKKWPVWRPYMVALAGVSVLMFTLPQLQANRFYNINYSARIHNRLCEWLAEKPPAQRLIINNFTIPTSILANSSAAAVSTIREHPDRLMFHWKAETFSEIMVLQREILDAERGWEVVAEDDLGPDYGRESVWTLWLAPVYRVRMLRITEVRNDHPGWRPAKTSDLDRMRKHLKQDEYMEKWAEMLP